MFKNIFNTHTLSGLLIVFAVAMLSFYCASLPILQQFHMSSMVVGIVLGIILCNMTMKPVHDTVVYCLPAINLSSGSLLRLGIIISGFNINLLALAKVGLPGFFMAISVVITIFILGYIIGIKFLKMDAETTLLTTAGSSICGGAAILAVEGVLKAKEHKTSVAVATAVVFGTTAMFVYPLLYRAGIFSYSPEQIALYIGSTVHGMSQVVAAASITAISDSNQYTAIITKMIKVMLLVPSLIIISVFKHKLVPFDPEHHHENEKSKITIPWFAVIFLIVIVVNSYLNLSEHALHNIKLLDSVLLTMAMTALGLKTKMSSFKKVGGKAFVLAGILFFILTFIGIIFINFYT